MEAVSRRVSRRISMLYENIIFDDEDEEADYSAVPERDEAVDDAGSFSFAHCPSPEILIGAN